MTTPRIGSCPHTALEGSHAALAAEIVRLRDLLDGIRQLVLQAVLAPTAAPGRAGAAATDELLREILRRACWALE